MIASIVLSGCATPGGGCPDGTGDFRQRAERQQRNGIVVEAAALSRCESDSTLAAPLNDINIQPVWLSVTSFREDPLWLFPIAIDRDYFPTYEVARRASVLSTQPVEDLYARYRDGEMKWFVPPQSTVSGYVFTHSDEGMKPFTVELIGSRTAEVFSFVVPVPGLPGTYFDADEPPAAAVRDLDPDGLRAWLDGLACCAISQDGRHGDPLNIVLVGTLDQVRAALISRRWDVTAPIDSASLRRMVTAFLFGSRFRYAPISSLYLFGREQDLAFQKSRAIIDERNHMRLWRAPVDVHGRPVWVGQVSRDVGVKLSGRLWPPTTHVIDPDVDDARFYVLQDLLSDQVVEKIGFTRGHRATGVEAPHRNAEDDPYFTDGLRNVIFLADRRVQPDEVELLDWSLPAAMEPYRAFYLLSRP